MIDLAWEAWLGSCKQCDKSCDNTDIGWQAIQTGDILAYDSVCNILDHSWMRKGEKDEQKQQGSHQGDGVEECEYGSHERKVDSQQIPEQKRGPAEVKQHELVQTQMSRPSRIG